MQGGTGGRTISDQDVAIILKALRQKFTATPESQVAVLEEVKRISQDIATDMEYQMSQNAQEAAGYYYVKALSAVSNDPRGYHRAVTAASIADRISGSGSKGVVVSDKVLLDSINMRRTPDNVFNNISEVPSELLEAARNRIKNI